MSHGPKTISLSDVTLPKGHVINKIPVIAFAVGILSLIAAFVLSSKNINQFYFSYLTSFMFWLTLALFGLFFVIVQHATRSGWSVVVRRIAENMSMVLPIFAILFIPIFLGRHELFHWLHDGAADHDVILQGKTPYLNDTFFSVRSFVYLVIWAWSAAFFYKKSVQQDKTGDHSLTYKMQSRSYPFLVAFVLTITFASFDWIMSLDPHWYSTIFGVYVFTGSVVGGFAFLTLVTVFMRSTGLLRDIISVEHIHDLGKLVMGFMVFWAYIAFSQYFLIWYGNIPEETVFYAHRYHDGWGEVTLALAIGHFVLPMMFLMSKHVKRNSITLTLSVLWMIFFHYVDIYWLVMPNFHKEFLYTGVDLAALVGIGGIFIGMLALLTKKQTLIPIKDPRLSESLAFENI